MLSPLGKQKQWEDDIASFEAIRKIGRIKVYSPGCCGISLFASTTASIMGTFVKDRQLLQ